LERAENNASNGGEIIDIGELLTEIRMALETVEKYGEKIWKMQEEQKRVAVDGWQWKWSRVWYRWKERRITHRMVQKSSKSGQY
jgi:hypothetical protein